MRVLVLVMSAQKMPWGPMIGTSMETWDSVPHPDCETIYYCGSPLLSMIFHGVSCGGDMILQSPFDEELKNLGRRTLHAYEHALTLPGWKHLARVNSSCYVHKRLLVEYCATKPQANLFCGLTADSNLGFTYAWGGGQYILSRDVVEKIVANKARWDHEAMEDVAASKLIAELGIPINDGRVCSINKTTEGYLCIAYGEGAESFHFNTIEGFAKRNIHHFLRVKHDADRNVDAQIMRELKQHLAP